MRKLSNTELSEHEELFEEVKRLSREWIKELEEIKEKQKELNPYATMSTNMVIDAVINFIKEFILEEI